MIKLTQLNIKKKEMKFKPALVLMFLAVRVCAIQQNTNQKQQLFTLINLYWRQLFVNITVSARSSGQCAYDCLYRFTPYCKAFIWNELDQTCSSLGEIVRGDVYVSMLSELEIYIPYKDGCTNKEYYYDLHSNTCLKMFVDTKTWKDAKNQCQENGGDLISLTTPAKWDFFINFTSCRTSIWIGLKDKMWVSNVPFDKTVFNGTTQLNNFDIYYPNDPEMGCGLFRYKNKYELRDDSCNFHLYKIYMCEIIV